MSPDRTGPLGAAVRAIWQRAREKVESQVEQVEAAATHLLLGTLDEPVRSEAARAAHKLAGSAGTFGFPHASETAARIELLLQAPTAIDGALLAELALSLRAQLLGGLPSNEQGEPTRSAVHEAAGLATADASVSAPTLILTSDDSFGTAVALAASALGMFPQVVHTESDALRLLEPLGCAAVLIDADTTETQTRESVERVAQLHNIPVFITAAATGLDDRLAALRQGAYAWVERNNPKAIVQQLAELDTPDRPRIVAIDDDELIREHLSALLATRGMDVVTTANAGNFWQALERGPADVALLDLDMPDVNGIELCALLRQDARYRTMAIIVLTAHRDPETINRVFHAGADDFVSKPIVEAELLVRIRNRLDRLKLLRRQIETDALTGLDNRSFFEQKLEQVAKASAPDTSLCLALLNLDSFAVVNLRYGRAIGDSVLREFALRMRAHATSHDMVARWGGDEFVWATAHSTGFSERLNGLLGHLNATPIPTVAGDVPVRFTAGLSHAAGRSRDLEALFASAELAVADGKRRGGNRIAPAGGEQRPADSVDVLIVDDDPLIRELLAHTLQARGYTVNTLSDGQQAADVLLREQSLKPRVVLLDVDLPGLDGIALLRRLRENGTLNTMRVIMLTARSSEPEIVKSLELDAFDHIAKPFSISVLIQRVRRALLGV